VCVPDQRLRALELPAGAEAERARLVVLRLVDVLGAPLERAAAVLVALGVVVVVLGVVVLDVARDAALPAARGAVILGAAALPATTSRKLCPARNTGTFVALTRTVSPLRGFRATRALRSRRSKVPNPTSDTRSPRLTATSVCMIRLPSTLSTSARATSVCF
jgi:hypothetical protein